MFKILFIITAIIIPIQGIVRTTWKATFELSFCELVNKSRLI